MTSLFNSGGYADSSFQRLFSTLNLKQFQGKIALDIGCGGRYYSDRVSRETIFTVGIDTSITQIKNSKKLM
jgi:2-polyprenyl-3-methyl-5-hydroxy-6-metoxy-1,4-benzoquinol methylase